MTLEIIGSFLAGFLGLVAFIVMLGSVFLIGLEGEVKQQGYSGESSTRFTEEAQAHGHSSSDAA